MFSTVKIGDGVAMRMNHFGCRKNQKNIGTDKKGITDAVGTKRRYNQ
jgi:hypothetical protein